MSLRYEVKKAPTDSYWSKREGRDAWVVIDTAQTDPKRMFDPSVGYAVSVGTEEQMREECENRNMEYAKRLLTKGTAAEYL